MWNWLVGTESVTLHIVISISYFLLTKYASRNNQRSILLSGFPTKRAEVYTFDIAENRWPFSILSWEVMSKYTSTKPLHIAAKTKLGSVLLFSNCCTRETLLKGFYFPPFRELQCFTRDYGTEAHLFPSGLRFSLQTQKPSNFSSLKKLRLLIHFAAYAHTAEAKYKPTTVYFLTPENVFSETRNFSTQSLIIR